MSPGSVPLSKAERVVLTALCRPIITSGSSVPASSQEIGDDLFVATGIVRHHLRRLADRFGVGDLPSEQQRTRLAEIVLDGGIIGPEDVAWLDNLF